VSQPTDVAAAVGRYAASTLPAVDLDGGAVWSPYGAWLLLAAAAVAAGDDDAELTGAVGLPLDRAAQAVEAALAVADPAVRAAVALWADDRLAGPLSARTRSRLPSVEVGPVPNQAMADAWVAARTAGLIEAFPVPLAPLTWLVLTSVLAAEVSWSKLLAVRDAAGLWPASAPWSGRVTRILVDGAALAGVWSTAAAGVVGVHTGVGRSGSGEVLRVCSVVPDAGVPAAAAVAGALEVAGHLAAGSANPVDPWTLEDGHAWQVLEDAVLAPEGTAPVLRWSAALPAWTQSSTVDLTADERWQMARAGAALVAVAGGGHPAANELVAVQSATSRYDRNGFSAAAVSVLSAVGAGFPGEATATVRRRTVALRFDRPFAVVAITGDGVPAFLAWVVDPEEAEGI
jgi:hypothetical protein